MSARQLQPTTDDEWPEWWFRLGRGDPDLCARQLATALVADPFDLLGFTALAVSYFRDDFGRLVEWLAEREPVLQHALPAVAAAMRLPVADKLLQPADEADGLELPQWLCEIDHFHRSRQARGVERQRIILQRQINQPPKQPSDEIVRGVPAACRNRPSLARLALSHPRRSFV